MKKTITFDYFDIVNLAAKGLNTNHFILLKLQVYKSIKISIFCTALEPLNNNTSSKTRNHRNLSQRSYLFCASSYKDSTLLEEYK